MPVWAATGVAWEEEAAQCGVGSRGGRRSRSGRGDEEAEAEADAEAEAEAEACAAQATVHIRDLADPSSGRPKAPQRGVLAGAFTVLSPAFPNDRFDREELKTSLQRRDKAGVIARLARSPRGLRDLGYLWVGCGLAAESRAGPGGATSDVVDASGSAGPQELLRVPGIGAAMLRDLLLGMPSVVQLLKVWVPLRVPVQPLAVLDLPAADLGEQQWWWHGGLELGDAVVLDALRCPHVTFSLPGEEQLVRACEASERLRAALEAMPDDEGDAPVLRVHHVCGELGSSLEDPAPFPRIGGRYTALAKPTALIRLHEDVESDVFAELKPRGIVTVLEVGTQTGRAKVFTDDAKPIELQRFEDGGDFSDSRRHQGKLTGWITSALYDGAPLLEPAPATFDTAQQDEGEQPSEYVLARITKMAATLKGICHWTNVTLEKAAGSSAQAQNGRIRRQYSQLLTSQLDDAHRVAVEAQCVALKHPGRTHAVAAISASALAVACGAALRLWRLRPQQLPEPSSQDLY